MTERDVMQYDVLVVGAGPAGLAAAIRLKQLKPDLTVCVLEKASAVGAHSLSGAVMEPGPLDELAPDWRDSKPDICVPATRDEFLLYTRKSAVRLITPPQMHNQGNFIVSLGQITPWLAAKAEGLGVDVFAGFSAAQPLFEGDAVAGVQIGDMGLQKDGTPGPNYTPGPEIRARITLIAEGCRGSLAKVLMAKYGLCEERSPQTFALGLKELWQLPPGRVQPGLIQHSFGWPLDSRIYGGSFVYHLDRDRLYVGFVVGLDYEDPRFKPFESFQQFKHHPRMKALLEGGEILSAGARTIAAGGWQSMPKLEMPGALLLGDAGGTVNLPKIKGIHQAIRSGMLAAQHVAETDGTAGFDARWRASAGGRELRKVRNFKPGFKRGLWFGLANSVLETVTFGKLPWTMRNHANWSALRKLDEFQSPDRGWVDRTLPPRDRLASVFFSATSHDEHQPAHLKVHDTTICATRCRTEYGNPCQNFCPANVYEMVDDGAGGKRLQINAANCVHCKACDIKDPYEIITWTTPEGGSGPNYQGL
ncbi:MAG TPA: electron transfer flavoprotein-ubiquinone oxidoreductase [Steroidobacteraceae bacterium]|nr:electron transfer flavoprotein-ubiquinone oxidoreductase [Steroidobacteraceae bacterium]